MCGVVCALVLLNAVHVHVQYDEGDKREITIGERMNNENEYINEYSRSPLPER